MRTFCPDLTKEREESRSTAPEKPGTCLILRIILQSSVLKNPPFIALVADKGGQEDYKEVAQIGRLPPFSAKRWRPKRPLRLPVGATAINALRPLDSAEAVVRRCHLQNALMP